MMSDCDKDTSKVLNINYNPTIEQMVFAIIRDCSLKRRIIIFVCT